MLALGLGLIGLMGKEYTAWDFKVKGMYNPIMEITWNEISKIGIGNIYIYIYIWRL